MVSSLNLTPNILVVDDTPENLSLLVELLKNKGYRVRPALNAELALSAAHAATPDLILLDVNMPGMDGYELCQIFKADPALKDVPVIFISIRDTTEDIVRAFDSGGADYVTKPFKTREVFARVEYQLTLLKQRRELEQRYQHSVESFEMIDRMKRFVQTATHDLKNPLNLIWGYVNLLEGMNGEDFERDGQMFVQGIRQGAEKMFRLITDILELMQVQTGANLCFEALDLGVFIGECAADVEWMALQKNIQLVYTPPTETITVHADQKQLGRIAENLFTNAIKYTPEGGQIDVIVDGDSKTAKLRVRDNGYGIPAEDLPHIFDEFYRVNDDNHRKSEGTGLGLTIVKMAVEQHSGGIEVESEYGKGSVFTVTLPRLP